MSGIWPTILTEGGLQYPENRNVIISILIFFGGAGGLIAPYLIGVIYNKLNLFAAMNVNYIFLAITLISIFILFVFPEINLM
ncbi:MAG: hypothetical protein ACYCZ1_09455 [Candidatus Humimicrobiaceae bacterium]